MVTLSQSSDRCAGRTPGQLRGIAGSEKFRRCWSTVQASDVHVNVVAFAVPIGTGGPYGPGVPLTSSAVCAVKSIDAVGGTTDCHEKRCHWTQLPGAHVAW